jgi:hypothetical protein
MLRPGGLRRDASESKSGSPDCPKGERRPPSRRDRDATLARNRWLVERQA